MTLLLEHWKSVVGFEGRYEVSCMGTVRRLTTGKTVKPAITNRGYLSVTLKKGGRKFTKTAHSLTAHCLSRAPAGGPRGEP